MFLNRNSAIETDMAPSPVIYARNALKRDMDKVFLKSGVQGAPIRLMSDSAMQAECFRLCVGNSALVLRAADALGFAYGLYEISRRFLGVENFWFWNDQVFVPMESVQITDDFDYTSAPLRVRYRGWFINDETLIMAWQVERRKDLPWAMAFEALLRCGGNLVIPGTDSNTRVYRRTASDMGLAITHHHAEPLGAEMFARAYPDVEPSYSRYPERFHQIWREGIEDQKGMKVLWNLGFRGQGDRPFWEDDPQYSTPQARGKLMSDLIRVQYDMVKASDPNAICVTNLYGETMELYKEGHLTFPDDVIKIWADNGFGKMITRRQMNHNPRIAALPAMNDHSAHGIYYHVSFYDLQAANHITMLPNSATFVQKELSQVLAHHVDQYWLVNCSNIKPHIYMLDLVAQIWREGTVNVKAHREAFALRYYGTEHAKEIADCIDAYAKHAIAYGTHEDEHAGEQFAHHVPRIFISNYLKSGNAPADDLRWAINAPSLRAQLDWYQALCEQAVQSYGVYLSQCEGVDALLTGAKCMLFRDSLLLQAKLHYHGFCGALAVCKSIAHAMDGDYQQAFYQAGCARLEYLLADRAMRDREHGKWQSFYANECQTDVKQSAWMCEYMMSHVRNLGDGPHFYHWQRYYQDSEEDRRIMLLLNTSNHLRDVELFDLMEQKLGR